MSVIKLGREVAVQTAKWNCLTVEQQLDMIYTVLLKDINLEKYRGQLREEVRVTTVA